MPMRRATGTAWMRGRIAAIHLLFKKLSQLPHPPLRLRLSSPLLRFRKALVQLQVLMVLQMPNLSVVWARTQMGIFIYWEEKRLRLRSWFRDMSAFGDSTRIQANGAHPARCLNPEFPKLLPLP